MLQKQLAEQQALLAAGGIAPQASISNPLRLTPEERLQQQLTLPLILQMEQEAS
eukprot:CAMPEP_0206268638 /NCGR_PEP_ID=MMETSP0047_2-20121206/31828_1 /ASSEMBLY_ACC=CAM_ASM_000192 /TAXON_ID=195065 /ORGANISM="Chroomonas mesostigmatica_cf, Strain CCMP1168" /LENGTH=53 /DNA_ID=CAMNT_0053696999 /DNA_START=1 /DNA_END=158 /DNA_ORIENTATION=+